MSKKYYKKSRSIFESGNIREIFEMPDKITSQFCFAIIDHCGR